MQSHGIVYIIFIIFATNIYILHVKLWCTHVAFQPYNIWAHVSEACISLRVVETFEQWSSPQARVFTFRKIFSTSIMGKGKKNERIVKVHSGIVFFCTPCGQSLTQSQSIAWKTWWLPRFQCQFRHHYNTFMTSHRQPQSSQYERITTLYFHLISFITHVRDKSLKNSSGFSNFEPPSVWCCALSGTDPRVWNIWVVCDTLDLSSPHCSPV